MRRPAVILAMIVALGLVAGGLWLWTKITPIASRPPIRASLAMSPFLYSGLVAVAEDRGYFSEAGLDLEIKSYTSGRAATEAMLRGEATVSTIADLAFALKILADPSIMAIASIASSDSHDLVARKDRGISTPSDLKGKRIGVSLGTSGEYYLPMFLLMNNIDPAEVTAVDFPPERMAPALVDGEVDAVLTWDVYVYGTRKMLGDGVVSWPAQGSRDFYWLLAAKRELAGSPEVMQRMLAALKKADEFTLLHRDEAKAIVMRVLGHESSFMDQFWDRTRLSLTLDQSLLTGLDDAAYWKLGAYEDIPDMLDFVYLPAMDAVAPKSVTLFR